MPACVFKSCKNRSQKHRKECGITFHKFPKDEFRKQSWVEFVRKERQEPDWNPSDGSVICSTHFKIDDFYYTKSGIHKLKKTAVLGVLELCEASSGTDKAISESANESHRCETPCELQGIDDAEIEHILETPRKHQLRKKFLKMKALSQKRRLQIKYLKKKCTRLVKKTKSLKEIINKLRKEKHIKEDVFLALSNNVEAADLCNNLIIKNKKRNKTKIYKPKISAALRKFALTLHFYSPSAYRHVRCAFNTCLPHPRTLNKWYQNIEAEPGFTREAFKALKLKSAVSGKLQCALIIDEMAIRRQKIWTGKKFIGTANNGFQESDNEDIASQALVLMLVSLNEDWKLPVAYFLTKGLNSEETANIIKTCLEMCEEVNVNIASLTFDGCATNLGAANILGCELHDIDKLKTYFPHPTTKEDVVVFLDPCHMIKLVRNAFESKRILIDGNGNTLKWQYLRELLNLQQEYNLHLANKLSTRHIFFKNQIMKVHLATQLLSKSVSSALKFCESELKLKQFEHSSYTADFVSSFNNVFDVFNSRNVNQKEYKEPLSKNNSSFIINFLNETKDYICNLKIINYKKKAIKRGNRPLIIKIIKEYKPIVKSLKKTGFLGFIICIESLKKMYNNLIEPEILDNIRFYRVSQDHLELFFGNIRQHGGSNNNPNALQFKGIYRKILSNLELRSSFNANCIPLENFSILSHLSPVTTINYTSPRFRSDDSETIISEIDEENAEKLKLFNKCLNNPESYISISNDVQQIVGYLAGWVVHRLYKSIKCEDCIGALAATDILWFHKLISFKDFGGLRYPSSDVFEICIKTEHIIRATCKESFSEILFRNINKIKVNVLQEFVGCNIFTILKEHSFDQPATYNHRVHLIRAIIDIYINIRFHYICKISTLEVKTKRQKFNKLVLFEGN